MSKKELTEDTIVVVGKSIPLSQYRDYFQKATGKVLPGCELMPWLNLQTGKTLKEATVLYGREAEEKSMEELLAEERFSFISHSDKAFIKDFTGEMECLGYDFGGGIGDGVCWGKYMIVYARKGVKNRRAAARIYIREKGIALRMFFSNVHKHRDYIENAPGHIKDVFTGEYGNCSCNPKKENCRMRKSYVIDGKLMEKCSGMVFEFSNPTAGKLPDYLALFREFYPAKKSCPKIKLF